MASDPQSGPLPHTASLRGDPEPGRGAGNQSPKTTEPLRCREPAVATQVDDGKVRVTRWDFNPGAETGFHRHGFHYVVVPVTDGTLLIELADGSTTTAELKLGVPYTRPPGVEHNVINGGAGFLSFVETEVLGLPG